MIITNGSNLFLFSSVRFVTNFTSTTERLIDMSSINDIFNNARSNSSNLPVRTGKHLWLADGLYDLKIITCKVALKEEGGDQVVLRVWAADRENLKCNLFFHISTEKTYLAGEYFLKAVCPEDEELPQLEDGMFLPFKDRFFKARIQRSTDKEGQFKGWYRTLFVGDSEVNWWGHSKNREGAEVEVQMEETKVKKARCTSKGCRRLARIGTLCIECNAGV